MSGMFEVPGTGGVAQLDLATDHRTLLEQVIRLSDAGLSWREYLQAPHLSGLELLSRLVRSLLWGTSGIALLHTREHMSDGEMRLLLLLIGRAIGRNITSNVGVEP